MISMVQTLRAESGCLSSKDLLQTMLKDCKSGPEKFQSCRIPVLSSDHKSAKEGMYFNFDRNEIKGLKNGEKLRFMLLTRVLTRRERWWYGVIPMEAALVMLTGDLIRNQLLRLTVSGKLAIRLF